ncbi:PSME3-interacting protein [Cocos nucifera]|uniref:PSME3-interacting protein n=1 Tax=Cocos nucifera TaxID=13894 RepID=A0A8K0MT89_COCNU|nr:PSME3-interacting protein [Cocos nucifera]
MDNEKATTASPPIRLVNFISEEELDQAKKTRGERVEDGTAQRDKPLYEILPGIIREVVLSGFLGSLSVPCLPAPTVLPFFHSELVTSMQSRRKYERQLADEEAQQLRSFQEAVVARSSIVHELKETPTIASAEEKKAVAKRSQDARPGHLIISVKPQAKKAKMDAKSDKSSVTDRPSNGQVDEKPPDVGSVKAVGGLVSYSDESDDD